MEIPTSRLGNFCILDFFFLIVYSNKIFPLASFGKISSLLYFSSQAASYVNNLLIYLNGFLTSYGHIWKVTMVTEWHTKTL